MFWLEALSDVLRKIKGFYAKLIDAKKRGVLLPAWRAVTGEAPPVSLKTLVAVYLQDPAARAEEVRKMLTKAGWELWEKEEGR